MPILTRFQWTLYLCLGALINTPAASQADGTTAPVGRQIQNLQSQVDSLRTALQRLQAQPQDTVTATQTVAPTAEARRKWVESFLRAMRSRSGVPQFNGNATGIIQRHDRGGASTTTGTGSFDLFVHTRLGERALFFADLEAVGGDGPQLPALTGLNGDAGSTGGPDGLDRLHVLEAWGEIELGATAVVFGKIDLSNYFDLNAVANDETAQFISGALVNSIALPFPDNAPGIRLRARLAPSLTVQAGAASLDNSGDRLFDDLFLIGGASWQSDLGDGKNGNYRLYAYLHQGAGDALGYGLSVDQALGGGLAAFGRWTHNDGALARSGGLRWSASVGLRQKRVMIGRQTVLGAALAWTRPDGDEATERLFEAYWRVRCNQWIHVSPHLQWLDPFGAGDRFTLFGIRTQCDF